MKIALTTSIYPPNVGGPATYCQELKKRLNHEVKVITLPPASKESNVFVLNEFGFATLLKVCKSCDLIYTQTPSLVGVASLLVAKILRKPIALKFVGDVAWERAFNRETTYKDLESFLRNPEGGVYIKIWLLLERMVLKNVNKIIVPSQFLKEILVKYHRVSPEKIRVIYNSVNLEKAQKKEYKILTIGRLIKHKRVDEILRTFKELEYPGCLQIVGEGPEKESLIELSRELGISNKVEFLGSKSHSETIELIKRAEIFVLFSLYEGLPHSIIEAMACHTPIVASNIRGVKEVIKDGENGLLVNNKKELKESIIRLFNDSELRNKLVRNAFKTVLERFTWERNLRILEKELEEMI
jgi:glycosyltransferase involved in cell wall biosynthesis